jgi:hypothetical protein
MRHSRSDTFASLVGRRMAATLMASLAAVGCSPPADTTAPLERLMSSYSFTCGTWRPSAPPVHRALFDLRLWQIDTASVPATQLVEMIEAAGGRVVYRYHGPMVRAELDVAAVPGLAGPRGLYEAVTVAEPSVHDVTLLVMLTGDLTAADLQAVEALGGRVTREWYAIGGYAAVIDDARVPAVRALPGVKFVGFDSVFCFA